MKSKLFMCLLVVAMFLISSCVTTDVAGIWKDETSVIVPMNKIMIVGVFKDEQVRITVENELVKEINKNGGKAFPSYKIFHLDKITDKAFIAEKLKEVKADSILISRITDRFKIGNYIPGEIYDSPPDYYHNLYTFTEKMYNEIIRVGYLSPLERRSQNIEHEKFTNETNIYSANTEKLIITIVSDTKFLRRTEKVIEGLAETVVKNLVTQNIIN